MATATFELKDLDTFLPANARGKGLTVKAIRTRGKNGQKRSHALGAGPNGKHRVTVSDPREIRHLKADTRFTLISETP